MAFTEIHLQQDIKEHSVQSGKKIKSFDKYQLKESAEPVPPTLAGSVYLTVINIADGGHL